MTATCMGDQSETVATGIATNAYFPARPIPILRIHLLGSMRATSYLGDDVLPRAKKARAALAYLCLAHQGRVPRSRIASMLWDRASAPQARTNFRQTLFDLNAAMGSLASELVLTGRATVRFNTNICWIDALALAKLSYSDEASRADLALLCSGELLEGFDEVSASFGRWLAEERLRFRDRIAALLSAVLQQTIDRGDTKHSLRIARRLISLDPTHRDASRSLMHALAELGEHAEALHEYERYREALWKAFRVKPDLASERLYESILAQVSRTESSALDVSDPKTTPSRHRLRVGVLSFNAPQPEKGLAMSLSHEIAAGLARFRWFDVISLGLLRPRLADGQHEYAHLDYVIDGEISSRGKHHLNIVVQLIELTGQARPVWSEQFDIALSELDRLDELVTTRIVARIDPIILHIEGKPKRRGRYGATGLLFLAIPMIFSMERGQYEQAGQLIKRALALEPDNAMAEAWAAHWHLLYIGQGWAKDLNQTTTEVQRHALKAITLDPENAEALGIYAHSVSRRAKDFDRALAFFDRALRLNPSLGFNWALSALTYCYIGEPDIALQRLHRYRELGATDLYCFEHVWTIAYTFKGDYQRAVLVGRRAVAANPNFVAGYKPLIASLGHLGRRDEARDYVSTLLSLEPDFSVEKFGQIYSIKKASDRNRYMEGLRLAGVPER